MRNKFIAMTVMLDQASSLALEAIAAQQKKSKAQVVREAVGMMQSHVLAGRPTCADGRPCLAPQLHGNIGAFQRLPEYSAATKNQGD